MCFFTFKECFNSPYGIQHFAKYAEQIPGQSTNMLSSLAKELKVFIVGGSIPEAEGGKYFNTCTVFSPDGEMVAKHRKVCSTQKMIFFCHLYHDGTRQKSLHVTLDCIDCIRKKTESVVKIFLALINKTLTDVVSNHFQLCLRTSI